MHLLFNKKMEFVFNIRFVIITSDNSSHGSKQLKVRLRLFYSNGTIKLFIMVLFLTKLLLDDKTHLSKVWLAAHWEKKLSRYHVYQIDIESTVHDIMSPEIILDLRLSGHLLVGIVKIFSRKTIYLLNECNSIFTRVKCFRPGLTDLPEHKLQAPLKLITLPESHENFDYLLNKNLEDLLSSNQSHIDEITLKETYSNVRLLNDDDFNENCLDEDVNCVSFDDNTDLVSLLGEDEQMLMNGISVEGHQMPHPQNHEDMDLGFDEDNYPDNSELFNGKYENINDNLIELNSNHHISVNIDLISVAERINSKEKVNSELLLEPLPGSFKLTHLGRKKRKLIIDEIKMLNREIIDTQLNDTSDITLPLDLAPPSKRLMVLKKIGGADNLLHLPGQKFESEKILKLYQRNLNLKISVENFDASSWEESSQDSLDRHNVSSGDLFADELKGMNGSLNSENHLQIHNHKLKNVLNYSNINGMDTDIEMSCTVDVNDDSLIIEPSQPINFANEFNQEIFSDSLKNTPYLLQDKICEMFKDIAMNLKNDNATMKFSTLVQSDRRIKVARKFLFLLILKKFEVLDLQQENTHAEITISRGVNFIPAYLELYVKN